MKKIVLIALLLLPGARLVMAQCTADAGPTQLLTCVITQVTLQGSSNATGAVYAWSGPGGFTSTEQNPVVSAPGPYSLTITDPSDGCTATAETAVFQDIVAPAVTATGGTLTCVQTSVNLNITTNPANSPWNCTGPQFFSWPSPAIATLPGVYTVIVTNPGNGCTSSTTVVVGQDVIPPVASATGGVLDCAQQAVVLDGSGSSTGLQFTYLWTTPNGQIQSGATTLTPAVSAPGNYTLIVTNTTNGCTATAQATVTQTGTPPDVTATGGTVGCTPGNVTLTAITSNPAGATFAWSGPNNFSSFVQSPVLLNAGVSAAGNYIVTVTNSSGCTATAIAEVNIGPDVPFIPGAGVSLTAVKCFGASDGAITIVPQGGTSPYSFEWTGPNGYTANTQNITGLSPGLYTVVVTDNTGCASKPYPFLVDGPVSPLVIIAPDIVRPCYGQSNGSINFMVSNGTPPYTYAWSHGPNTLPVTHLGDGIYTLTVTDANGCSSLFTVEVEEWPQILAAAIVTCEGSLSAQVSGGAPPYSYAWQVDNGPVVSTASNPGNLPPGVYHLSVTDSKGCTAAANPVTLSANGIPCTRITGRIILDENTDCSADSLEPPLGNWFVQATGPNGTFYGLSDSSGQYAVSVLPGAYTLTLIHKMPQTLVCQNDLSLSLDTPGDTAVIDFLAQVSDADCPALSVSITTALLRRCFNTNYYHLQYCNEGPGAASDAYIDFKLDAFMSLVSATKNYTDLGNNVFRFPVGNLFANDCGSFWIRTEISCDAVLGQTHCSEARIYPDTLCGPPNPGWSGALVEVNSQCDGDSLDFILKNTGTGNMTQALEYIVIEDGIMSYQGAAPPLQAGQSMTVSVPANGATWRIEARQEPLAPVQAQPVLSVEGCTTTGSFSTGLVNQFGLGDQDPWLDVNCMPNVGSYDPNDKQGFPLGYGAKRYIRPGTELEYLIRFQNTGTDTAFTVVIRDTLSEWLDPLTVQAGAASHPYRFTLAGEGVLIFDFQNILLPDSNVNEPASHGFVQFRIRPRADVPLETDIFNSAAIYFDFNEPIITNTTVHRVGENFVAVGLWEPRKPAYTVSVYPQPVHDAGWIAVNGPAGAARLRIFDQMGRPVLALDAGEPRFFLQRGDLPAGVYLFSVESGGILIGTGKLVVR